MKTVWRLRRTPGGTDGHRRTRHRARDRDRTARRARAGAGSGSRKGAGPGAHTGVSSSAFLTEPIVAWRLWHVRRHDDVHRLESFTWHHVSWPAGTRFEAGCSTHGRAAPVEGHECGLYAFKTRELAADLLRRQTGGRQDYGSPKQEMSPPPQRGPTANGPGS